MVDNLKISPAQLGDRLLTLGQPRRPGFVNFPRPRPPRANIADEGLLDIETSCRLKAEGVRWASSRRLRMEGGCDLRREILGKDREILERARGLPDCRLWMNVPGFVVPGDDSIMEDLAGCYEVVADGLKLVRRMLPDVRSKRRLVSEAFGLLAESQSALRCAIDRAGGPSDPDQFLVYVWLRESAATHRIRLRRHMKLCDIADPSRLPELRSSLEALEDSRDRYVDTERLFNVINLHAQLIGEVPGSEDDWRTISGAIEQLIENGVRHSSVELRELLLPIIDKVPDLGEMSRALALTLREIERYGAARPSPPQISRRETTIREVVEVSRLLGGRSLMLVGGAHRPAAQDRLRRSFALKEVIWIEARKHESIEEFKPFIARPDVALVLLAIRWSSHSHGDAKRLCDQFGKPFVRLPGGYNPSQVAAQILSQCSEQLSRPRQCTK